MLSSENATINSDRFSSMYLYMMSLFVYKKIKYRDDVFFLTYNFMKIDLNFHSLILTTFAPIVSWQHFKLDNFVVCNDTIRKDFVCLLLKVISW